jgi:hypothetical protein
MINAEAIQDLVIYILSSEGTTAATNDRTVDIPMDVDIPLFVKDDFGEFYRALFETAYNREGQNVVFREYAGSISNCDPCSADPLTPQEQIEAGVFWPLDDSTRGDLSFRSDLPVYLTRLHVRYTRDKFPEDLQFHTQPDQGLFQGRYVLRYPFLGKPQCKEASTEEGVYMPGYDKAQFEQYRRSLPRRFEQEARTLSRLTGWDITEIRQKMQAQQPFQYSEEWWQQFWRQ